MTGRRHGIDALAWRPAEGLGRAAVAWAPCAVLLWAIGYGGLRVYWASGNAPEFPPLGADLLPVAGWGTVALVGATAPLAVALARAGRWRWPLAGAGWR